MTYSSGIGKPSAGRARLFVKLRAGPRFPYQREHRIDRALRRLRKLRSRIDSVSDDGSIPGRRPKGMREATFQRLVAALVEAEMAIDDAFDDYATRLERRRH